MTTFARHSLRRVAFTSACIAAACTFASPAWSADAPAADVPSIRVAYDDLRLATDAGVNALYRRLQSATAAVCEPLRDMRDLRRMRDWRACRRTALEDAVRQIGHPALTRRHAAGAVVG